MSKNTEEAIKKMDHPDKLVIDKTKKNKTQHDISVFLLDLKM